METLETAGVEPGFCECGCGRRTRIAPWTCRSKGWVKGTPLRFVRGHAAPFHGLKGEAHPNWRGGRSLTVNGYVRVRRDGDYAYEHRLVMEALLGRPLRPDEHVHHIDGDKTNNRPENLELLDVAEHTRLHARLRAVPA